MSSVALRPRGLPQIVWRSASDAPNAPLMNCACGTVSVSAGSSGYSHMGRSPKIGTFMCVSSLVMTAPLFVGAPCRERHDAAHGDE